MSGFPPRSHRYSSADLYASADDQFPQRPAYDVRRGSSYANEDDDEDADDDQPWTTSYSDFRRTSQPLSSAPRDSVNRYSQAAPTLVSSQSFKALDMVEEPMLAKEDWKPGEASREYHAKSNQRKDRAAAVPGRVGHRIGSFVRRWWKWLLAGFLGLAISLAVTLYFVIPRVPSVDFWRDSSDSVLLAGANPFASSTAGNFSFTSDLHVAIDASASWIPVHYDAFRVELRVLETDVPVAHGPNTGLEVPGRKTTVYAIPLNWSGSFGNGSDPTYAAIFQSCQHIYPTTVRPGLNLTMTVTGTIRGRVGSHTTDTQSIMDVPCPVEFSGSSA